MEPTFQLHACHVYGCGSEVTSAFLAVVEVCVKDSRLIDDH